MEELSTKKKDEPETTQTTTEVKDEEEPCTSGQGQKSEPAVSEEAPKRKNATMVDVVAKLIESLFALIEKKQWKREITV